MNIYVGNLPYSVRDEELREAFEKYGTVNSAEVIFDKRTRRSRGYGFVEMLDDAEGQRAIAALNGAELQGRELRVDASQPKTDKRPSRPEGNRDRPRGEARSVAPVSSAGNNGNEATGIRGLFKRLFS